MEVHFLGARGQLGEGLALQLESRSGLELRPWSGASGATSYTAFDEEWRRRSAESPECLVVIGGGRVHGGVAELVEDHLARLSRWIDLWNETVWPTRVALLGSAAELLAAGVYAAVKWSQRVLLESALPASGTALRVLRIHSVVPDAVPRRGLHGELLTQFRAGGSVSVHHLGGARDYVSIKQLGTVLAALAVGSSRDVWAASGSETIDVGNGVPVRVEDWLEAFRRVFGRETALHECAPSVSDPEIVADCGALNQLLSRCGPRWVVEFKSEVPDLEACVRRWQGAGG